jgi:hypothetical protein
VRLHSASKPLKRQLNQVLRRRLAELHQGNRSAG